MSEFEKARQRAERRLGTLTLEKKEVPQILQPPKQKGRSNEIEVKVWVNGECLEYLFNARITANLLQSQLTQNNLKPILKEALSTKFTGVE